jgi:hypothetical protein
MNLSVRSTSSSVKCSVSLFCTASTM